MVPASVSDRFCGDGVEYRVAMDPEHLPSWGARLHRRAAGYCRVEQFTALGAPTEPAAVHQAAGSSSAVAAAGVNKVGTEPTTVPGTTATVAEQVNWMYLLSRHKVEETAGLQKIYADDGTTVVASAVVSDDGTTYTRAKFLG